MSIRGHVLFPGRCDEIEHELCQQATMIAASGAANRHVLGLPVLTIDATGALRSAYRNLLFFR
jgi:hypothetical protein